jgi:hypothetical protein
MTGQEIKDETITLPSVDDFINGVNQVITPDSMNSLDKTASIQKQISGIEAYFTEWDSRLTGDALSPVQQEELGKLHNVVTRLQDMGALDELRAQNLLHILPFWEKPPVGNPQK